MKEKLELLMKSENLTAVKLAGILEIQPSRLSQIKAERSKQPSYDIVYKILSRFPQINPDWLLLDSGQMYRPGYSKGSAGDSDSSPASTAESAVPTPADDGVSEAASAASGSTSRELNISEALPEWTGISNSQASSKIERIIVIYTDGTFQDFRKR